MGADKVADLEGDDRAAHLLPTLAGDANICIIGQCGVSNMPTRLRGWPRGHPMCERKRALKACAAALPASQLVRLGRLFVATKDWALWSADSCGTGRENN